MTHCTDDDLVLHYYGESRDAGGIARHMDTCVSCANAYHAIQETLQAVRVPSVPERDAYYELRVWHRVHDRLGPRRGYLRGAPLAAAAAVVLVAAFMAGRLWPREQTAAPAPAAVQTGNTQDRARLAATSDHLEQSERVLLDVLNADGDRVDLSAQQTWASDLIESNRFYRDAAAQAGDTRTGEVLDTLERNLLDVVHGPSLMTPAQMNDLRARVDAAALLFKVRLLANELRERDAAPAPSGTTS